MNTSTITLKGIQVKSLKKAKKLSKALSIIEEECGIHSVKITIKDSFICPDIKLSELSTTPMEELVADIFLQLKQ